MSATNTLEAKAVRRKAREVRHSNAPEAVAEYDYCVVTGKWAITDKEHGISQRGWDGIREYGRLMAKDAAQMSGDQLTALLDEIADNVGVDPNGIPASATS